MKAARHLSAVSPPPVRGVPEDHLTTSELATEVARLSGLLAHRIGVKAAFATLMRVAGALGTEGPSQ